MTASYENSKQIDRENHSRCSRVPLTKFKANEAGVDVLDKLFRAKEEITCPFGELHVAAKTGELFTSRSLARNLLYRGHLRTASFDPYSLDLVRGLKWFQSLKPSKGNCVYLGGLCPWHGLIE